MITNSETNKEKQLTDLMRRIVEQPLAPIINDLEKIVFTHKNPFIPEIPDIYKWFPEKNIKSLGNIYSNLMKYKKNNENIYNFLITCFVSTIRKSSYADDTSPKPYVSTRIKKIPLDSKKLFTDTVIKNLKIFIK